MKPKLCTFILEEEQSIVKLAIGHAFPFSYLLDGEHAAFAGNAAGIVFPSLILLGFTVLAMLLAFATFRWDPNAPVVRRGLRARATKVDHAS